MRWRAVMIPTYDGRGDKERKGRKFCASAEIGVLLFLMWFGNLQLKLAPLARFHVSPKFCLQDVFQV